MRKSGSVTVAFSFVFLIMFSFILSFFEMASFTARASYHASAARLATENYFAAYLEPMYSKYHIFGREIPEGEEVLSWTEGMISEDVSYMTEKKEGDKSLLLRAGAKYNVTDVTMLTENELEGFYTQAVTAMKYRGVLEVADLLKAFAGMSEQAEAHLEVAAAKAATDSAYGRVDEKLLYLMALVDGVDIKKYEKFLGGKLGSFQKDSYVKYFCTNPEGASVYFDRTEVYQAFLKNHENPCKTLDDLCKKVEELAKDVREREEQEAECRSRLAETEESLSAVSAQNEELDSTISGLTTERWRVAAELIRLKALSGNEDAVKAQEAQAAELDLRLDVAKEQKRQAERKESDLEEQKKQLEKEQKRLEKKQKEQEKAVEAVKKEEKAFVKRCKKICEVCDEGYDYTKEIQAELKAAQSMKATYESVMNSVETVLGSDVCGEYREDLKEYLFYESAEGYDFEQIRQTLSENKSRLRNMEERVKGATGAALERALEELKREREIISKYSFQGLKLDYGEMSLEKDMYSDVEDSVSSALASGFLGFLTDKELSEKVLDTSYLPSGFRYKDRSYELPSLPGGAIGGLLNELQSFLPKELSFGGAVSQATEQILFHSYLVTHFSDFVEEDQSGALSYEQEYLIAGEDTDIENLSSVAARICGIRTILHFISIYTDSAKKAPIEQAALAACGIIGLPALKSIIVLLLVFVWALEEAMVDTAALLQGKKLSLYPGKTGGSLSLPEILMFSKSFVLGKAKSKSDGSGAVFGYKEYLQVFLFLKAEETKKYRGADLIQENLRKRYASSFRVNRCVWKIAYRTDEKDYEYRYE